jgi:hypothetical protein
VFASPSRIAPAAFSRATTVASSRGTTPTRSGAPIAIGIPGRGDVVLDRERDAAQRTGVVPAGPRGVGLAPARDR